MLVTGVLCAAAATVLAVLGLRSLTRPAIAGTAVSMLRSVAPPQLAAATMLAVAGSVALAAPRSIALMPVCVCVIGAIGTIAAGSYQTARYALHREEAAAQSCAGACAGCTLTCR